MLQLKCNLHRVCGSASLYYSTNGSFVCGVYRRDQEIELGSLEEERFSELFACHVARTTVLRSLPSEKKVSR